MIVFNKKVLGMVVTMEPVCTKLSTFTLPILTSKWKLKEIGLELSKLGKTTCESKVAPPNVLLWPIVSPHQHEMSVLRGLNSVLAWLW